MTNVAMLSPRVDVKSVLVATDLSEFSDKTLEHGIAVARHYGATLHLAHVVSSIGFALAGPETVELAAEAALRDMDCMVSQLAASGRLNGVEVRPHVLTGNIDEEVGALECAHCVDLVVTGLHGNAGIPRLVLGSVPQLIAKRCSCPVLTVGPRASRPWIDNPDGCERPLLLATASSVDCGRAMAFGTALAHNLGRSLFVLQAGQSAQGGNGARSKTQRPADATRSANPDEPVTVITENCGLAQGILRAAQRINAANIVVAAQRNELSYWPFQHFRNVLDQVNREARCPVLTMRA